MTFKCLRNIALAALVLVCAVRCAGAAQTGVSTFRGAVVWAGPAAAAAGGFEQDTIDDGSHVSALSVNISVKSSNPNDVQVFSQPFSISNGQAYTLTYHAKCDAARTGTVCARINNADYHSIGFNDPAVQFGPSWKTYSETFVAANAGAADNVIAFSLGDQAGIVRIVCVGVWSSELSATGDSYVGWTAAVEKTMRDICAKRGIPYVSVEPIAADPAAHGFGRNPGVQWHPNDVGHAKYADAIFTAVRPLIPQSDTH